jgi:DNA polymerase III delta subunit
MKAYELGKTALAGNAFYIDGEDCFWVDYAIDYFKAMVPEEYRQFNLHNISQLSSMSQIAEAVNTYSMFPAKTVVIVRGQDYKELAADKGMLEAIADSLQEAILVVVGKNLITTAALHKIFIKIDAGRLIENELITVLNEFYPQSLTANAASLLVRYCNRDMRRISNEMIKLRAYREKGRITEEDVRLNVADDAENEIYEFSNALARRDNARAYGIMERFIDRSISYSYMLATLAGQYRRMLYAALSPLSDEKLAEAMGIKPYGIRMAREAARNYTKTRLKSCLDALTEAEFAFKSGVMGEDTAFLSAVSKLLISGDR